MGDEDFIIACHFTTLGDGTQLDNSQPAPEFIIAGLEKRTGIKRPEHAERCALQDLNMYFVSGGMALPKPLPPEKADAAARSAAA